MNSWRKKLIGDVIEFNPTIKLKTGTSTKKVPMPYIGEFRRKIYEWDIEEYKSGPKFENNDILLAKINPSLENGKAAKVDILDDGQVGFGSTEFIVLRETDESDANFIYYLVISPTFRKKAIGCMEGTSGRRRVNENSLKYFELPFPEKLEQQRIGEFLSDLDAKIEVNNKINAELEAMAKLIYDYWFVQFEFPTSKAQAKRIGNFSLVGKPYKSSGGKMVYNEQLKREIPEGWKSEQIGNLLAKDKRTKKILASEYLEKGQIPIIDQSTKFICGYTNDKEAIITTDEPRIIFGDHTRIVKLINFDFARGADGTQVLLSNNDCMPQHLFYHSLLKIDLSNYGYARHFKFLKDIRIVVPNIEPSNKFEKVVKPYFEQVRHNIIENQKLAELRDWLLPMLMNGQATVRSPEVVRNHIEAKEQLGMVAEDSTKYKTS